MSALRYEVVCSDCAIVVLAHGRRRVAYAAARAHSRLHADVGRVYVHDRAAAEIWMPPPNRRLT